MCGRFLLTTPTSRLSSLFQFDDGPALAPRYNVAPSQPVAAVRPSGDSGRECVLMRWGLVPSWAKDVRGGGLINARAETAATKPAFRDAFRGRRCLIPADGFYEWKRGPKKGLPFAVRLKDGGPFAFAGLWDVWQPPGGEAVEGCAVLTTEANDLMKELHQRMPVILRPENHAAWLDPGAGKVEVLQRLLRTLDAGAMTLFPVSDCVNNARHEGPQCLEPRGESQPTLF
jgi:putative SOS response-associated peptidase YedK